MHHKSTAHEFLDIHHSSQGCYGFNLSISEGSVDSKRHYGNVFVPHILLSADKGTEHILDLWFLLMMAGRSWWEREQRLRDQWPKVSGSGRFTMCSVEWIKTRKQIHFILTALAHYCASELSLQQDTQEKQWRKTIPSVHISEGSVSSPWLWLSVCAEM